MDSCKFWFHSKFWCLHQTDLRWLAWCAGISLPLLLRELPNQSLLISCLLILFILRRRIKGSALPMVFIAGLLWAGYTINKQVDQLLPGKWEGIDLVVTGQVQGLVHKKSGNYSFLFLVKDWQQSELNHLNNNSIRLSCYRCNHQFDVGQDWTLTVRLKRPRSYANHGSFDSEKFYFRHKVIAKGYVRPKQAQTLNSHTGFHFDHYRQSVRDRLSNKIDGVGLAIILALTIGDKSAFEVDQREVFKASGISHLLAISGLHIGLIFYAVLMLIEFLLRPFTFIYRFRVRQNLALAPALCAAVLYSAMAGFAIPTQRALIMLMVFCLFRLASRPLSLLRCLLLACVLLLAYDPLTILDLGFWLSVNAVFIIGVFLDKLVEKPFKLFWLQLMLWIGMLPISLLGFGQLSLIAPLVNLILVPSTH